LKIAINYPAKTRLVVALCFIVATLPTLALSPPIANLLQAAHAQFPSSNADTWYIGKGIKPDTFLRYRVFDNYTEFGFKNDPQNPLYSYTRGNGGSFEFVLYFQRFVNDTVPAQQYWVVPTYFVTNSTVMNGTINFFLNKPYAPIALSGNSSAINEEIYSALFVVVSAAASYPGQPLNSHSWTIDPEHHLYLNGTREITVPAGSFNCTVVGNSTCISGDLPYPVSSVFSKSSTIEGKKITFLQKYELLEIGHGIPTVPEFPTGPGVLVATAAITGTVLILGRYRHRSNCTDYI
jgi:hypothetical protein